MKTAIAPAAVSGLAIALLIVGCGTASRLESRMESLGEVLQKAEAQGAYRCAPTELALGRAHLAFAADELERGNAPRAKEHVSLAEPNVKAALTLSPPGRCDDTGTGDRDADTVIDKNDRCPDVPEDLDGVADEDGCPDDEDTDGDTVVDSRDLCVFEAEDLDAYLDADGCPELDNDLDQVPDAVDACANDPEDRDSFADGDGCPDLDNDADSLSDVDDKCPSEPGPADRDGCPREYKDVQVTATAIRISQKIYFETNKSVIQGRSFEILDTVATVLADYPAISIEIQGHTDSRGPDAKNLKLSESRANAVRAYLLGKGVAPERLSARGYGEERPIDSNKTASGREANRRVEFVRTDADAKGAP